MRRHSSTFFAVLAALLLGGCNSTQSGTTKAGGEGAVSLASNQLPAPQVGVYQPNVAQAEYRIGPLDLVEIAVFQVDQLNKTVQVNASGMIALPLIGNVQAAGKSVSELEAEIAAKLGATYLQSPQVSVFIKEANSQKVTVDGAVKEPGMKPLSGQTTLLQTIAMSGGLDKGAKANDIVVFRTANGQRTAAKFNLAAIRKGKAQDPLLYGGDVVVVGSSAIRTALGDASQSIPVFSLFMPLL